jgi:hypothetical protein
VLMRYLMVRCIEASFGERVESIVKHVDRVRSTSLAANPPNILLSIMAR